mgnify:CR=1 FL=1
MSLYVDSSALLKRYIDEPDSEIANALLASDPSLLTARHALVEIRRNLARLLDEGVHAVVGRHHEREGDRERQTAIGDDRAPEMDLHLCFRHPRNR